MSPIPTLCNKFVELTGILKDANPSKRDSVVLLMQDMLEVGTRDMTANEIRELVELGHGTKDAVPRRQLFAGSDPKPAIVFPSCSHRTLGRTENTMYVATPRASVKGFRGQLKNQGLISVLTNDIDFEIEQLEVEGC